MADFKEAFRSWMQRTDDDEGDTQHCEPTP